MTVGAATHNFGACYGSQKPDCSIDLDLACEQHVQVLVYGGPRSGACGPSCSSIGPGTRGGYRCRVVRDVLGQLMQRYGRVRKIVEPGLSASVVVDNPRRRLICPLTVEQSQLVCTSMRESVTHPGCGVMSGDDCRFSRTSDTSLESIGSA